MRTSVETIAEDLFNAENNARLAAEAAGREAAGRPDEGTPEELAAILLAEEAEAAAVLGVVPDAAEHADGPLTPLRPLTKGPGRRCAEADDDPAPGAASTAEGAPPAEEVDALFAKIRAAHAQPVPSEPSRRATRPGE